MGKDNHSILLVTPDSEDQDNLRIWDIDENESSMKRKSSVFINSDYIDIAFPNKNSVYISYQDSIKKYNTQESGSLEEVVFGHEGADTLQYKEDNETRYALSGYQKLKVSVDEDWLVIVSIHQ